MRSRRAVIARACCAPALLLLGCRNPNRAAPIEAVPSESAPIVEPSPSESPAPAPTIERTCEPHVHCGVWTECAWFERVDATHFRATSGRSTGRLFVRSHACWPVDAGLAQCAVVCTGPGATGACVDGLVDVEMVCTGTAVPHPADAAYGTLRPIRCEVHDGACVDVVAK